MRRIHWKATARRQRLQSRVYEPTTELAVALFLAVDTFPPSDPARPDDPFEGGVSLAASISLHLLDSGCPVGLYANGGEAEGAGCLELAPGSSGDQAARILEALARIAQIGIVPVEAHLLETVPRLPWGASVMVIAGEQTEPLSSAAAMLRTMGHKIEVQAVVTEEESVTRETNGQKREV